MASGTTGTWGRPYPLSTDAPNVHTDIQALANSLETVPLFPQAKTTSFSAAAGFSYAAGTGVTATLPASPATGDTIRVAGSATVTGAAPATVTAAGGKGINGLGLAAASTFKIGTPWAYAMLQYDGTNWQIIDGGQDTGWVTMTRATNVNAGSGAYVPAYRTIGNMVYLRGAFTNATGGTLGPGGTWATALPAPASTVISLYGIQISTGGALTYVQSIANGGTIGIDTFWYPLS
jgi:hypothetical protein